MKKHTVKSGWLTALLMLYMALVMTGCMGSTASQPASQPEQAQSAAADSQAEQMLSLPYTPQDSLLEIQSLFQFSGFNPDCDGAEGENTAAIQVQNISVKHITSAEVLVQLASGENLRFVLQDLPSQGTAMVFEADNAQLSSEAVCTGITCTISAEEESPVMAGQLAAEPGEMQVTLTNTSAQDLPELTVYCHSMLEGQCFGGITYAYPVPALAAGQSTVVDTPDCYLDTAQVVRVEPAQ